VLHGAFPHREVLYLKNTMYVWNDDGKTAEIASSIIANRWQVHYYSATAGSQSSLEIILLSVRV